MTHQQSSTQERLFLFLQPDHLWLLDSRPRDALNTHDLRIQHGHPGFANELILGKPADTYHSQITVSWHLHRYMHVDDPGVLQLGEDDLDDLQFGGKRNYGYGQVRPADSQLVDLVNLAFT